MKSLIVLPLILHLNMIPCFAFPKPQPEKVNVEVHTTVGKLFVSGLGQPDFLEMATTHNSIELKKGDRYTELLNIGLARKKQKSRDA
jgi:hypothetical protein